MTLTTDQNTEERLLPPRVEEVRSDVASGHTTVTQLEEQARTLIRQRPVVAVLVAAGVGYLVARVVARGTRW